MCRSRRTASSQSARVRSVTSSNAREAGTESNASPGDRSTESAAGTRPRWTCPATVWTACWSARIRRRRAVYALERGLDLAIVITVHPADRGCRLELRIRYTIGGLAGRAVERATIGPERRQIVQALTKLGARFQNDTRRGSRRHGRGS
jgi:hypothetical protein